MKKNIIELPAMVNKAAANINRDLPALRRAAEVAPLKKMPLSTDNKSRADIVYAAPGLIEMVASTINNVISIFDRLIEYGIEKEKTKQLEAQSKAIITAEMEQTKRVIAEQSGLTERERIAAELKIAEMKFELQKQRDRITCELKKSEIRHTEVMAALEILRGAVNAFIIEMNRKNSLISMYIHNYENAPMQLNESSMCLADNLCRVCADIRALVVDGGKSAERDKEIE